MRIHHIALRVESLVRSREFYAGILGLEELVVRRDSAERTLWLRASETILMLEPSLCGKGASEGSGHVLAFSVDSLSDWEVKLTRSGIPVDDRTEHTVFVRDPDGHRVALTNYPSPMGPTV